MRRATTRRAPRLAAGAALALGLASGAAGAAGSERPAEAREAARAYFSDVELVDHRGERHRLYSDLLDGKVVAIDSMFTTCGAVCPVLSQKMKRLQEAAGDRLGRDVHLLSITVDPENDTPAELAAYAERFGAKPGWYFLSGEPQAVRRALAKLGYAVEDKQAHSTIVLMGNEQTGLWKKTNGLASGDELVALFESVLADTGGPAHPARGGR